MSQKTYSQQAGIMNCEAQMIICDSKRLRKIGIPVVPDFESLNPNINYTKNLFDNKKYATMGRVCNESSSFKKCLLNDQINNNIYDKLKLPENNIDSFNDSQTTIRFSNHNVFDKASLPESKINIDSKLCMLRNVGMTDSTSLGSRYSNCSSNTDSSLPQTTPSYNCSNDIPPIPTRIDSCENRACGFPMHYSMYETHLDNNKISIIDSNIKLTSHPLTKKSSCPSIFNFIKHFNEENFDNIDEMDSDYGYIAPRLLRNNISNSDNDDKSVRPKLDIIFSPTGHNNLKLKNTKKNKANLRCPSFLFLVDDSNIIENGNIDDRNNRLNDNSQQQEHLLSQSHIPFHRQKEEKQVQEGESKVNMNYSNEFNAKNKFSDIQKYTPNELSINRSKEKSANENLNSTFLRLGTEKNDSNIMKFNENDYDHFYNRKNENIEKNISLNSSRIKETDFFNNDFTNTYLEKNISLDNYNKCNDKNQGDSNGVITCVDAHPNCKDYKGNGRKEIKESSMKNNSNDQRKFTMTAFTSSVALSTKSVMSNEGEKREMLVYADGMINRCSTGSTSSGSQASSGFESAKLSNCSSLNVASTSSASMSNRNIYGLESPSASSIISSTSSGAGSTASHCSTNFGSVDLCEAYGITANSTGCTATAGPSCSSSGIQSDASSSVTTISPSSSNFNFRSGRVNIAEMLQRGIAESEILAEWLQRLCLSQYLCHFITQGYDLASIARVTPEDLTALGITRPDDRKRLIQDIQHWNGIVLDNWPNQISGNEPIRNWLSALGLLQYVDMFESNGYKTVCDAEKLTWEDLEDIGVKKLGHMKRICLALKKSKTAKYSCNIANGILSPPLGRLFDNAPPNSCYLTSCIDASGNAYATIHRKRPLQLNQTFQQHQQQHQEQQQQEQQYQATSQINGNHTIPKQRPIVAVYPSQQHRNDEVKKSSCSSDVKKGTVIYHVDENSEQKNLNTTISVKKNGVLKLNLYRTSQILSESTELPRSFNDETLKNSLSGNKKNNNDDRGKQPPPPAPMPFTIASANDNLQISAQSFQSLNTNGIESHDYKNIIMNMSEYASRSQPTTPRNVQRIMNATHINNNGRNLNYDNEPKHFHSNGVLSDFESVIYNLSQQFNGIQHLTGNENVMQKQYYIGDQQHMQQQMQTQQNEQQQRQQQQQQQQQQTSVISTRR